MKRQIKVDLWLLSILFFTLIIIPASFAESLKDSGGILMKDNAPIFLKDGSKIQCNMVLWYYLKEDCIQCRQRTNVREFPIKDVDLSNTFDESIALEYDEMKNQLTKKYADSKKAREKNVAQHELDPKVKQDIMLREKRKAEEAQRKVAEAKRKTEEAKKKDEYERQRQIEIEKQEQIEASKKEFERNKQEKAEYYFKKAEIQLKKGGYGPTKQADLLRSIGQACLNCPGTNFNKAVSLYSKAEEQAEEIRRCLHKYTGSSPKYKDKYYWRAECVISIIKQARILKRTGDSYMGCSEEMMRAESQRQKIEELEERLEDAEDQLHLPR